MSEERKYTLEEFRALIEWQMSLEERANKILGTPPDPFNQGIARGTAAILKQLAETTESDMEIAIARKKKDTLLAPACQG